MSSSDKEKKVTWNDLQNGTPKELMKTYGLDERSLERAKRRHLYGASQQEMRKAYDSFYRRNRKDA